MASIQPKNTIRPYPTHNIKFQKNSKKIKKIPLWVLFNEKYVGEGKERQNIKIIVPMCSYPTHN